MFEERQYAVVHAEEYIYDRTHSSRDFAAIEPRIPELAQATAKAGIWVMPNLTAFKNIGLQANDLQAILDRPEMRFMPPRIREGWGPATNPYTRRFGKDQYPRNHGAIRACLKSLSEDFARRACECSSGPTRSTRRSCRVFLCTTSLTIWSRRGLRLTRR